MEIRKLLADRSTTAYIADNPAGESPSKELVDAYEMANGKIPITGYTEDDHLHPNHSVNLPPLSGLNQDEFRDRVHN